MKKQLEEKMKEEQEDMDEQELEDEEDEEDAGDKGKVEKNPSAALDKIDDNFVKTIKMKLDDYRKEHNRLINVLQHPTRKTLKAEAKKQIEEVRKNIM